MKTDTDELLLISNGRVPVFHSVGAVKEKDLAPYVFKLEDGVKKRSLDDECSQRGGVWNVSISRMYDADVKC